ITSVPSTGGQANAGGEDIKNIFGGSGGHLAITKTRLSTGPTSALNLLGQIESWGSGPATSVTNVSLHIEKITGTQLQQRLKNLRDGVTYRVSLEKEGD